MKTIAKLSLSIHFVLLFVLLTPTNVFAEWYWITEISDPETGYFIEEISPNTIGYTPTETTDPHSNKTLAPENFMDTMDETEDSDKCSGELDSAIQKLRQFDASEEIVQPSLKCGAECSPYYAYPEQTMEARKQLLLDLESDAQSCLVNEQTEIEEAIDEQERKEAEEARIVEVQKAVSECDFDYFENEMTNDERMDTWNERQACATKAEVVEPDITEVTPVVIPEPVTQPVIAPTPVSVITQNQTPATFNQAPTPLTETTDVVETETEATTTEPEKAQTESEETVIETEPETTEVEQAETKPSFFKRVVSFFTSLFSW